MLKTIFKAVTAFTLLVGCYFSYVRVFALVVRQMTTTRNVETTLLPVRDSNSKLKSIELARSVMPKGHFSTADDLAFRYYNAERGYWMYAQDFKQIKEENGVRYDGKRIRLTPFLVISTSRDGKSAKTISSDVAIIDLNQALGFSVSPDGEPLKVKHIHLEPNVVIRDNKGTPLDPNDDMKISPLTTLDYDEPTQQITTESHVVIEDPDMVTTGDGMLIQLRKDEAPQPGGSSGFDGAERLELFKNVHVVMYDVGKSGMMPGMKKPRPTARATIEAMLPTKAGVDQKKAQSAPPEPLTPLDLTCDSKMQVFLPRPPLSVPAGPPAPPAPTIVQFDRNVVVLRGQVDDQPSQLTCDTLKLTMVPEEKPSSEKSGLFGNLTLQRAHATGHAVWLYLPAEGIKLRCNEMIHTRLAPLKPDLTYFRGDLTRPLELEKVDVVQDVDSPDRGKVTSVTHIRTVDATMYDKGNGFDSADVVANGPGRLETTPDRDQPVERIAIWQDKLEVHNELGSDGRIKQKIIFLTGKRPCFIDKPRESSIDSAQSIKVLLVPKAPQTPKDVDSSSTIANSAQTGLARSNVNQKSLAGDRNASGGLGGGSLDIKRLLAFRDVHLLAPAKTMTARKWLDAEFIQVAPPPAAIARAAPSNAEDITEPITANTAQAEDQAPGSTPGQEPVVAKDDVPKKPTEPPMVGSAERMWVKVEMKPKPPEQATANNPAQTGTASTRIRAGSTASDVGDKSSEIREAWLWGSVALHQDPPEGKTKGQDASGEALYLDNRGEGKAITLIYQREPNVTTDLPGPLPPARVENEQKSITGAGIIAMNQATDQAWVEGPGILMQLTKWAAGSPTDSLSATPRTAGATTTRTTPAPGDAKPTASSLLAENSNRSGPADQTPDAKPKTRAGRPIGEKVPSTIRFSEGMEFNGRSVDPEGHPAGRADFYGIVTAQLEDALLYCEDQMIAYTDRVVPLAQLGSLAKTQSKPADSEMTGAEAGGNKEADDQPQLALIECYRNALGISRKVDPIAPIILQQQRIQAQELLVYDRRTGNFHVPGKGKVFLYDRSDNSKAQGMGIDGGGDTPAQPTATGRIVTPASNRAPTGTSRSTAAPSTKNRNTAQPQQAVAHTDTKTGELPRLVLTQIHFTKGMRGRFGSTVERDRVEPHWYEFFGNIELGRAKVSSTKSMFEFDKLPTDGMFLTGQTLRVRTEPPPVGSPLSTPARDYVKAWENAYVSSNDKSLQADVITYDSEKDLIYAFGEGGRGVIYAQQYAAGQPSSLGSAKAVRLHPKTGAAHFIDNSSIQLIDKNTGARPVAATPSDPDAKYKKPPKKVFRIPSNNVERRGFTSQ